MAPSTGGISSLQARSVPLARPCSFLAWDDPRGISSYAARKCPPYSATGGPTGCVVVEGGFRDHVLERRNASWGIGHRPGVQLPRPPERAFCASWSPSRRLPGLSLRFAGLGPIIWASGKTHAKCPRCGSFVDQPGAPCPWCGHHSKAASASGARPPLRRVGQGVQGQTPALSGAERLDGGARSLRHGHGGGRGESPVLRFFTGTPRVSR